MAKCDCGMDALAPSQRGKHSKWCATRRVMKQEFPPVEEVFPEAAQYQRTPGGLVTTTNPPDEPVRLVWRCPACGAWTVGRSRTGTRAEVVARRGHFAQTGCNGSVP